MSVVIKGVEAPISCNKCFCCDDDARFCMAKQEYIPTFGKPDWCPLEKPKWCPLVELPENHGRLLDENDVIDAIHARLRELQTHKAFIGKHGDIDLLGVFPYIAKIKAVVEAEGEE